MCATLHGQDYMQKKYIGGNTCSHENCANAREALTRDISEPGIKCI